MSTNSSSSNDSSSKDGYENENEEIISTPSLGDEEYGVDVDADQEQTNKVNSLCADLCCLCVPVCAETPNELFSRLSKWFLGNSDQFLSSMIGKLAASCAS